MYGSFGNKNTYSKEREEEEEILNEDKGVDVTNALLNNNNNDKDNISTSSTSQTDCDGQLQSRSDGGNTRPIPRNVSSSSSYASISLSPGSSGHLLSDDRQYEHAISVSGQKDGVDIDRGRSEKHRDGCKFSSDEESISSDKEVVYRKSIPTRVVRTVNGPCDVDDAEGVVHSDFDRDAGHVHNGSGKSDVCDGDESTNPEHTEVFERPLFTLGGHRLCYTELRSKKRIRRGKHGSFDSSRTCDSCDSNEKQGDSSDGGESEDNDGERKPMVYKVCTRRSDNRPQEHVDVVFRVGKHTPSPLLEKQDEQVSEKFISIPLSPFSSKESNVGQEKSSEGESLANKCFLAAKLRSHTKLNETPEYDVYLIWLERCKVCCTAKYRGDVYPCLHPSRCFCCDKKTRTCDMCIFIENVCRKHGGFRLSSLKNRFCRALWRVWSCFTRQNV